MAAHGVDEPTAASPAAAPSWPPAARRKPGDGE